MLEGLLKGLVLWLYQLILEGVENLSSALIEVFNMDLAYFEAHVPVTAGIIQVMMAAGWALLIGNLVFQAMRAMASGLGFEGEDPNTLFTRTFVFSFLLMASRQICNIGLTITGRVMDLVGVPDSITINIPKESHFGLFDSTWLVVVVIGLILIFQIIRFFFEIAERYVILATLTIMAPLAFGMGGSKSTEDIFKGWARMYGSMCVMMLMNVVFLKLLLSAMETIPSGAGVLPWLLFVVAIARVARKVDDLVCRIGLNPARTGDPLGRGVPLMVTMAAVRGMSRTVAATMGGQSKNGKGGAPGKAGGAGHSPRPGTPPGSGGGPGQGPSRQREHFSQTDTAAAASVPTQRPAKAVGQSASVEQQRPTAPVKGQGKRPQKGGQSAPGGKQGGPKVPGSPAPPPARPPIQRGHRDAVSPQEPAGQGGIPPTRNEPPSLQGKADTVQSGRGQGPAPVRPPIQRNGNPSQERPQSQPPRKSSAAPKAGEAPPPSRRNDPPQRASAPNSGETPPASRRKEPPQKPADLGSGDKIPPKPHRNDPQQTVTPGSGEAPPAFRRNSEQQRFTPPAAEIPPASRRNTSGPQVTEGKENPPTRPTASGPPPGPRRDSAPQTTPLSTPPDKPQSPGRKNAPPYVPSTQKTPQPTPHKNTAPVGTAPQKPQRPSRPPLNQERGGKP